MRTLIDRARQARLHDRFRARAGDRRVILLQRLMAVPVRRSLRLLAAVYWTDKAGNHSYIPMYERHFRELRGRRMTLLEIGIGGYDSPTWGGASLRMWRDYFRRSQVHGLDINSKDIHERRMQVHQGDQTDVSRLHEIASKHGPFDIVIDDGSHVGHHILVTFEALFGHVKPGGWYVIEDMGTAYDPAFGGGPPGTDDTSVALVKGLVDEVNRKRLPSERAALASAVHIYEQIAFIRRAP